MIDKSLCELIYSGSCFFEKILLQSFYAFFEEV